MKKVVEVTLGSKTLYIGVDKDKEENASSTIVSEKTNEQSDQSSEDESTPAL